MPGRFSRLKTIREAFKLKGQGVRDAEDGGRDREGGVGGGDTALDVASWTGQHLLSPAKGLDDSLAAWLSNKSLRYVERALVQYLLFANSIDYFTKDKSGFFVERLRYVILSLLSIAGKAMPG